MIRCRFFIVNRLRSQSDNFQINALIATTTAAQLNIKAQIVGRVGVFDGFLIGNMAVFIQVIQSLVEGLHADVGGFLHDFFDAVDIAAVNQVGNQWGI